MSSDPQCTEEMMRLKQRKTDKRRYLKIRPKDHGPWAVVQPQELAGMFHDDAASEYEIVETWMTIEQYEALGEFDGW